MDPWTPPPDPHAKCNGQQEMRAHLLAVARRAAPGAAHRLRETLETSNGQNMCNGHGM